MATSMTAINQWMVRRLNISPKSSCNGWMCSMATNNTFLVSSETKEMPGRSKRAIHKRFQREQTVSVLKSWECPTHTPTKPHSMHSTTNTPAARLSLIAAHHKDDSPQEHGLQCQQMKRYVLFRLLAGQGHTKY